jgi:hypothetical protein
VGVTRDFLSRKIHARAKKTRSIKRRSRTADNISARIVFIVSHYCEL